MIGPAVWRSVGAERCANWFAGGAGSRHIKTPTLVGGPNVWGERRFSNPVERGEEFLTCDLKALGYLGVSSTCVAIDGVNGSLLDDHHQQSQREIITALNRRIRRDVATAVEVTGQRIYR